MGDDRSWRSRETSSAQASPVKSEKLATISPCHFYKRKKDEKKSKAEKNLDMKLNEAKVRVTKQNREKISVPLQIRRSAYKQVSVLHRFPLQAPAMDYLDQLLSGQTETDGLYEDESSGSTGSSNSFASLDEKKKLKGEDDESVSNMRVGYINEFLREKAASVVDLDGRESFLPALWSMEPRMFAAETSKSGKRKYVVGNFGRFCDHYWRKVDAIHRHYYELIREGDPCRLYFDLEFCKKGNEVTESETEDLLDELFFELSQEFHRQYSLTLQRSHIIDLDSSTDAKFSRHWIVHLPNGALFRDSLAVGRFVKAFFARLVEEASCGSLQDTRPTLARYLFVNPKATTNNDNSNKTPFIDLGVYTRNRLFRLMGATKFGKPPTAALRIAKANRFPFKKQFQNDKFYAPLMKQQKPDPQPSNLDRDRDKEEEEDLMKFQSNVDFTDHAQALADTLVVPLNVSKIKYPILEPPSSDELTSHHPKLNQKPTPSSSHRNQFGSSPFPNLDRYITSLSHRSGPPGSIRCYSIENSYITYQIKDNRYCENIKRCHKSNGIMWVVDLKGMKCWQRCHDPDCRMGGFRGEVRRLEGVVREEVEDYLFELEMVRLVEEEAWSDADKRPSAAADRNDNNGGESDTINNNDDDDDDDDDEAEFNKALLALNLGPVADHSKSHESHANASITNPNDNKDCTKNNNKLYHEEDITANVNDSLDDALCQTIAANPELFPPGPDKDDCKLDKCHTTTTMTIRNPYDKKKYIVDKSNEETQQEHQEEEQQQQWNHHDNSGKESNNNNHQNSDNNNNNTREDAPIERTLHELNLGPSTNTTKCNKSRNTITITNPYETNKHSNHDKLVTENDESSNVNDYFDDALCQAVIAANPQLFS